MAERHLPGQKSIAQDQCIVIEQEAAAINIAIDCQDSQSQQRREPHGARSSTGALIALPPGAAFWTVVDGAGVLAVANGGGSVTGLEAGTATVRARVDQVTSDPATVRVTAPGTYSEFAERTSIKEERGTPSAEQMIRQLVEGQEATVRTARSVFPLAERANDQATADLLTQRLQVQTLWGWMIIWKK